LLLSVFCPCLLKLLASFGYAPRGTLASAGLPMMAWREIERPALSLEAPSSPDPKSRTCVRSHGTSRCLTKRIGYETSTSQPTRSATPSKVLSHRSTSCYLPQRHSRTRSSNSSAWSASLTSTFSGTSRVLRANFRGWRPMAIFGHSVIA